MPGPAPDQVNSISDAITAVNSYIDTLQATQRAAALAGESERVVQLHYYFLDANSLEERLAGLLTIQTVESLKAAVGVVSQATQTINQQKAQIDRVVRAVEAAATVLNAIASVAAAVARIVALVP
jgi:hypothetical protein